MIDPEEYDDLIYSIYSQVEGQLYDTVTWETAHLELDDDEINEMHSYVMNGVIDLLAYGPKAQN